MDLFCSTIIPTIGRSTLTRAVSSVLDQTFHTAAYEVIVVNDSGQPLPPMPWQACERVRVIDTNRRERSVARNTGAAIARGQYLHFLDDDDELLPNALAAFWSLAQSTDVAWLYGSYQTVDNQGNLVAEFDPGITGNIFALLVAGEAIPFQTSLVQTDCFYTAGAFDPTITGVEDRDLGRRLALCGTVAYTPTVMARIRIGEQNSTTNWAILAEDDRWGREKALRDQRAYARLQAAAASSYWRGRISRAYWASMVWNWQRRQMLVAASRALSGVAFTGRHVLSSAFWHGLRTKIK